jgi:hypothetical protein
VKRFDRGGHGNCERLQERAQAHERDVASERSGGVGRAAQLRWNGQDAFVPQLGSGTGLLFEGLRRHAVDPSLHLEAIACRPGMEQLQRKERIAAASRRGALGRSPLERQGRLQELLGFGRAERSQLDDAPAVDVSQCLEARERVAVDGDGLAPRGQDHPLKGQLLAELGERFEGALRPEVQVVEPQEDRTRATDSLEDLHDRFSSNVRRIEEETLAGRSERHDLSGGRRPEPLGRGGHEGVALVILVVDFPAVKQRLFDEFAVGALEPEVRIDGADDAVERCGYPAVARPKRHHQRPLVDLLTQPLGEAALADAGFAVQEHELLPAAFGASDLLDDGPKLGSFFVARDERARAQAQSPSALAEDGAISTGPES